MSIPTRTSKHGLPIVTGWTCPNCDEIHNSRASAEGCDCQYVEKCDAVTCPHCDMLTDAEGAECSHCDRPLTDIPLTECPECGGSDVRDFIGISEANDYRGCAKCLAIVGEPIDKHERRKATRRHPAFASLVTHETAA